MHVPVAEQHLRKHVTNQPAALLWVQVGPSEASASLTLIISSTNSVVMIEDELAS
eukprot:CAMPEP_0114118066 /NCGR_PEP_ID=MMETSP0043_2-20121206/5384_1 /TAXON_ID=464988 /ORGANISM="Hemiselmis andersenii, Strain CCMP644" /LENGTH=54 /DNA_ID=CAMNT_0001210531 /DNA_START=272 /DNA_END=437 /DNA_ORIENTATION=-